MKLDSRSSKILQLVVEAFIETAQPVSSSLVAKRGKKLQVSAATIRAVMAELEAAGYLTQPHTSAGRVPTDAGVRAYVDGLVSPKLRPWDRTRLEAVANDADVQAFSGSLSQGLAGLAGQVAVVAVPRFLGSLFREVGLVRCGEGRFLAYFVSPTGLVQQKLVEVDFDVPQPDLESIQNFLNAKLAGRTLAEVRELIRIELEHAERRCDALRRRALVIGEKAIPEPEMVVHVAGAAHLAEQPEFADRDRLCELLAAIEEKRVLLALLDQIIERPGVRVMLGSDHQVPQMVGVACVGGAWTGAAGNAMAVSLLGPPRMDYGRLVPLVGYATELVGRFWERI